MDNEFFEKVNKVKTEIDKIFLDPVCKRNYKYAEQLSNEIFDEALEKYINGELTTSDLETVLDGLVVSAHMFAKLIELAVKPKQG